MTDPRREDAAPKDSDWALLVRLLQMARPYWLSLAGILAVNLLATPIALLSPLPLKIAIDSGIGSEAVPFYLRPFQVGWHSETIEVLVLAAVFMILIAVAKQLQKLGAAVLRAYTKENLALDFRTRLFERMQRLSYIYHDRKGTSDAIYRVQYDAPALKYIAIDGIVPLASAGFTLAGMLWVTFALDWQLALVALGVSPVLLLAVRHYHGRLRSQWRDVKNVESSAMGVVQEVLTSLRVVKAFGQEDREQDRYVGRSEEIVDARVQVEISQGTYALVVGLTTATGSAVVLLLGSYHVLIGIITLGQLLIIMSYLSQLYEPLKTLGQKVTSLQSSFASAERVFGILDRPPELEEASNPLPLHRANGTFGVEGISFGYREDQTVLREISFHVPAGLRVGIAGPTGAGKTTLVNLLARFHDPDTGRVLLDGADLRKYRIADLRRQFAIVLQEPVLFSTTIRENIAYARPEASDKEIVRAAKAANIHEVVAGLDAGYDTLVGERGMRLSGGERQRVSLARAFLKDAPILILDEPTSSIDMQTEDFIMEAMERLMVGRTTFMIAHRLTTLRNCDLMLVLREGRLAEVTGNVAEAVENTLATDGSRTLYNRTN